MFKNSLSIYGLFAKNAKSIPDAIAIIVEGKSYTYREIQEKSNILAYKLRKIGVGKNSLVGLYLDRSVNMVAAILAVYKCSAAYVPLDPSFPADRLNYMISDSRLKYLLYDQALTISALPEYSINLNAVDFVLELDTAFHAPMPDDLDLAYVIYTSGSTGLPKGVKITHGAVINFLLSMKEKPGMAREDIWLAVTTLSFDISVLELLLPLTVGARIVLATKDEVIDGHRLSQMITDYAVTVMQATPATWKMLFYAGWQGAKNLKVLCGGEKLDHISFCCFFL